MILPEPTGLTAARRRMARALAVAATTPPGDVPIGAVVFGPDGRELACATNRREADGDPMAHAEVLAIRQAVRVYGDGWRLSGCELVVTVEPCVMCAGTAVAARIGSIVFGAWEDKTGACGSFVEAVRVPGAVHVPEVRGGVCATAGATLIQEFFQSRRG